MTKRIPAEKASDRLLAALPNMSLSLMLAGTMPARDADLARELGVILHAILRGEPAGKLFRQDERKKPRNPHDDVALVFWFMRACGADHATAIQAVKRAERLEAPKSAGTIYNIAKRHRDKVLARLDRETESARPVATSVYLLTRGTAHFEAIRNFEATGEDSAEFSDALQEVTNWLRTHRIDVARLREVLRKRRPRPEA